MSDGTASNDALPRGTVLRGYSIRQVLGQGGFGIVYRARHIELGNVVAIKEYLPAELAVRVGASVRPRSAAYVDFYQDGLRRFRKEGQALVALHNESGIVSCRDFFRRNNTAYLVMEFEAGMPLSQVLQERESEGRPFSEEDLMEVAVPLLEGLGHVHAAGIVHRDIKPSNLLLREANGEPVLIDFGAAKHDAANQTKSMAPRTPGYAAWEQIVPDGELGPWTDIYAIGVLLWRIVAGGSPISERMHPVPVERRMDAVVRGEPEPMASATELGSGRFNPEILAAIDSCLKLKYDDRIQDCTELLGLLRLEGGSQYDVAMRIYRRIPGYHSRDKDSRSEESDYSEIRTSPLLPEVVKWLSLAAANDHAAAQYELAFLHHHGMGLEDDPSLARQLLHRSAESGYCNAQHALAFLYGVAFLQSRYEYRSNLEDAKKCARWLNYDLQVANECYRIHPTQEDREKPDLPKLFVQWYCKCDVPWLKMGSNPPYSKGRYVKKTTKGTLFSPPMLLGYIGETLSDIQCMIGGERLVDDVLWGPQPFEEAQYEVGRIFEFGESVPQNFQEAVRWYRLVAELERGTWDWKRMTSKQHEACKSADSRLRELARSDVDQARDYCWSMYNSGRILPRTAEDAFNWIQFGAALGNTDAQYHLGWMYWNGMGVSYDYSESVNWFRTAARSGNPDAQNSLGVSYFSGKGVVQSYAKAQAWFLLAAVGYGTNYRNMAEVVQLKYTNIPDQRLLWADEICCLLNCITRDDAMRNAIEWEDKESRECYLSAYDHLVEKKEENMKRLEQHVDGSFQFNPTSEFFHDRSGLSFTYRSDIDPNKCQLPNHSTYAFRMHPWDLGCLRSINNFATSRFLQFHSTSCIDPNVIQSQEWFLPIMSWLSDFNYSRARYARSIFIANEMPDEAFSEMCLAADQNHCASQVILSMMYVMSEGVDPTAGIQEEQLSGFARRRYWIDARAKFGPSGNMREFLPDYFTRSITRYHGTCRQYDGISRSLDVEQSQFDLNPWGIWGYDISICRLYPRAWYELFPLFHSGNVSDSVLEFLRSYVRNKIRSFPINYYPIDYDEEHDRLEPEFKPVFNQNVSHIGIVRQIRSAAYRGDSDAQFAFGSLYASGDGVSVDYALAVDFFRESATSGNEHACFVLGILYEYGLGVARDDQESQFWFLRSRLIRMEKLGIKISENQGSNESTSFAGERVEMSSDSDRSGYLIRGQAMTPCLRIPYSWKVWFEFTLGWKEPCRWLPASVERPSWDAPITLPVSSLEDSS